MGNYVSVYDPPTRKYRASITQWSSVSIPYLLYGDTNVKTAEIMLLENLAPYGSLNTLIDSALFTCPFQI